MPNPADAANPAVAGSLQPRDPADPNAATDAQVALTCANPATCAKPSEAGKTAVVPAQPGWKESLHSGLDAGGLIPGVQELANGANTVMYLLDHDYVNAGISALGIVPFAGDVGIAARLGSRVVKGVQGGEKAVQEGSQLGKLAKDASGAPVGAADGESALARGSISLPPRAGESASGTSTLAPGGGTPPITPGTAGGATAGKGFPQSVRQSALEENPGTCVYCRQQTDKPQVDHAIPKSRGGDATIDNAQTTCGWCNASKGARDAPVNPPPGYEGAWPPGWWPKSPGIR